MLNDYEVYGSRILNYLARPIHDNRGSLLQSSQPITDLERSDVIDQLAPNEVEMWLQEYASEYNYLITLARFGYSLNVLVHVYGYKVSNRNFNEFFDRVYPAKGYKDANKIYLESLNYIDTFPKLEKCLSCGDKGVNIYSYCTKDELSRTYCTDCYEYYHYENEDCIPNKCSCENGEPKEFCGRQDNSTCESCDAGYIPDGSTCRLPNCVCPNGYPASNCPSEKAELCVECDEYWIFENGTCVWPPYECTCITGIPKSDGQCFGGEDCSSCYSGYEIVESFGKSLCTRKFTGNVLRSGDTIGLHIGKRWLSFWGGKVHHNPCPGSSFDSKDGCRGERITIVSEGKATGETIMFGDVVGLYYSEGNGWLYCESTYKYYGRCTIKKSPDDDSQYWKRGWTFSSRNVFSIRNSFGFSVDDAVRDGDVIKLACYSLWLSMATESRGGSYVVYYREGDILALGPKKDGWQLDII